MGQFLEIVSVPMRAKKVDFMDAVMLVNGVKVAYTLSGEGLPIVLLHGWMCNRGFWNETMHFLSQSYQVLSIDFRGHGDSDVPNGGHFLEQLAEDAYEVIEELGFKRVVLVGHSMGGMVAQQFCVNHMDHVSGLLLVTTIAADIENRLISKRIELETPRLGFRNAFLKYFEGWFAPSTDQKLIQWVREEMLRVPEHVGISLVRSYRQFDLRSHLLNFSMPTLVIGAGADASAVPFESKILAETIPTAQLVMVKGSGHFPMLENPMLLNKAIEEFLSIHNMALKTRCAQ
jgi:3-oxoadipate enol-lactonase